METYYSVYYFILDNQWTFIIIFVLLFFYYIREKYEDYKLKNPPRSSSETSEEIPEYFTEKADTIKMIQETKSDQKVESKLVVPSSGSAAPALLNIFGLNLDKKIEINITPKIIKQLKNMDNHPFWTSRLLSKIIPKNMIDRLVEKSLSGELKAGMKVKYENGEVRIVRS